ncbi:MAG: hypothetical protein IID45_12640 [Planctomycetes bacterium]|nr:hypothetical protein [Planctomycetota bacterium]
MSLMDDEKVRLGSDRFISHYRGVTLFFSSAEYKKRFTAHQKKYWPADNGNCTVTAGENHKAGAGNPKFAVIYKQRLWFFADAEHRQRFARKPQSFPAVSQ